MAGATGAAVNFGGRTGVRVVVAGDPGTGKSSLIIAVATGSFPQNVQRVVPPTRLAADYYPDRIPVTIIDTTSGPEYKVKMVADLRKADAVILTYACDRPSTLERVSTYWLPELRQLEVKAPVIVVGCMLDLRDEQRVSLERLMLPIMQQFREVETCLECSALRHLQVPDVFYYAQKAVLYPTAPLFDQETQSLKSRCVRTLKRIFILCDHDKDGALNDAELNDLQVRCFDAPLQPSEIVGVKRVIQEMMPEGLNERGLTLTGFLYIHLLFIEKGRHETTWTVLRKFGYDDEIKLRIEPSSVSFKRAPDQSVELTAKATDFLRAVFGTFDVDRDGALTPADLDGLFSTAPENPWAEAPYRDAAAKNVLGGLSIEGFLSEWALMTIVDPVNTFAYLNYIGYSGDFSSTFSITRKRRIDRKKQQSLRNVIQCFVFGPRNSGKSSLLDSFLGKAFSDRYSPTSSERIAANVVDLQPGGGIRRSKTLVMREVPEHDVRRRIFSSKDSLAACDVAVFVYDRSSESSWKAATELLFEVATHGENTGFEVPCLIVSAKDDLDPYPAAVEESIRISQDMGIGTPVPVSMKLGERNSVFRKIVNAAEHPHLSIPETEAGRSRRQYRRLVNRSLMFASVGVAVAAAGVAAYKVYAARKSAST